MRDILLRIFNSPVLCVIVCIWMAARYCHEAVTGDWPILSIVKTVLATAIGVGCVIMYRK